MQEAESLTRVRAFAALELTHENQGGVSMLTVIGQGFRRNLVPLRRDEQVSHSNAAHHVRLSLVRGNSA